MALRIGQNVNVRVYPHGNPSEAVTDRGATLYVEGQDTRVFLPAIEYPEASDDRHTFLRDLRMPRVVTVRVTDYDETTQTWEVSRKALASGDPWEAEVRCWRPGQDIQRMRVTSVHGNQIYGEIIPGVVGTTSLRAILQYLGKQNSATSQDETSAVVLIGDYLKGYVGTPDDDQQIVPLDVVTYLQDLDRQEPSRPHPSLVVDQSTHRADEPHNGPGLPIKTVLVVDDDPKSLAAIARRLQAEGLTVLTSRSLREAESTSWLSGDQYEPPDIDVAIIDVNLNPSGDQIDGLRLASKLPEHHAGIKILLMSGDPDVRQRLARGDAMGLAVHGFVTKPFGPIRLRTELARAIARPAPAPPTSFLSHEPNGIDLAHRAARRRISLIEQRVEAFCKCVGAEYVALFAIHRLTLVTNVIAGIRPLHQWDRQGWNFWHHKLRQSPVRDVAMDGKAFLEKDAREGNRIPRNRWLQRAYGYRSCLGVPVRVVGKDAHCLFAFHASENKFTAGHQNTAEMYATELAAVLEKERLLQVLEAETRYVTSGITLNVLGHELRSTLGTAALTAQEVYEMSAEPLINPEAFQVPVQDLREAISRAVAICETFVDLARRGSPRAVSVRDCIERAARFAQRRVEELEGYLEAGDLSKDLFIRAERVAVEQTLFNLFVNAAEQCKQFGRQGRIRVTVEHTDKPGPQAHILVTDNGPGIHSC